MLHQALRLLGYLGRGVWDAVVPQTCAACGVWIESGRGLLCAECAETIEQLRGRPYCPRCGRTTLPVAIQGGRCPGCRREQHWNTAGIARVGSYQGPLRGLSLALKLGGQERAAAVLGRLLAEAVGRRGFADRLDALVPVPRYWLKRFQRPCDHAGLLAAWVGSVLGVPVIRAVCRTRYRPSQSRLASRRQRLLNVRGCFALRPRAAARIAGKSVCIVDNVLVTGATACEMARVLRQVQAQCFVAVVARAAAPFDNLRAELPEAPLALPLVEQQSAPRRGLQGLVNLSGPAQA